jgi:hypothetical protein
MVFYNSLEKVEIKKQVRGFFPTGMLEYWNIGMMGLGISEEWVHGIIRLTMKFKID